MAIEYSEDFDGVTAPDLPTGYTAQGSPTTFATATDQYRSSPNSLKINSGNSGSWRGGYKDITGTTETVYMHTYVASTNVRRRIATQNGTGAWDRGSHCLAGIYFNSDGYIYYFDGAVNTKSIAYNSGAWKELKIVHDFDADTYDAWYDGDLICTGAAFDASDAGNSCVNLQFQTADVASDIWIDDIQIGDAPEGWPGASPTGAGVSCGVG